jgi:putative NIF3 family GTP cyclohydrolase 1 type 2
MKLGALIETCNAGIPQSRTWRGTQGEGYGAQCHGLGLDTEIRKVLYCVTHAPEIEHYAVSHGYDLTISHHPCTRARLPHLVYHTALDCCRNGLNDMWASALGLTTHTTFDDTLGAVGRIQPTPFEDVVGLCKKFCGDVIGAQKRGTTNIEKIVICTGLGGMVLDIVERFSPDCYITGELVRDPEQSPIPNIIEIGHTLSERCGVTMFETLLKPHGVGVDIAPIAIDVFGGETYTGNRARYKMNSVEPLLVRT